MKRFAVIALAIFASGAIALGATPASADRLATPDGDDSAGPLDIERITHGHGSSPGRLVHKIRMFEAWDSALLAGPESWLGIHIQSDPDRFVHSDDRFIWVKYNEGQGLTATMHEMGSHPNGPIVGNPKVTRPNDRTIRIAFRRNKLEGRPKAYRYSIDSSYEDQSDEACSDNSMNTGVPYGACVDRAPDFGADGKETFLRHRIR